MALLDTILTNENVATKCKYYITPKNMKSVVYI